MLNYYNLAFSSLYTIVGAFYRLQKRIRPAKIIALFINKVKSPSSVWDPAVHLR